MVKSEMEGILTNEQKTPRISSEGSALAITVGGTVEPILTSLRDKQPTHIAFIVSERSASQIEDIRERSGIEVSDLYCKTFIVKSEDNLPDCFSTSLRAIEFLRESASGAQIIADPTGGTKLMSAALALAAADAQIMVSYITGKRTKGGLGIVTTGSEQVITTAHPYDLISRRVRQRIVDTFNTYRFKEAEDLCQEIKTGAGESVRGAFSWLSDVCQGFRKWDMFDHSGAYHLLKSRCASLISGKIPMEELTRQALISIRDEIANLLPTIKLLSDTRQSATSKTNILSLPTINDLLANADRRAKEGKYDDAVARLYRALEMIAQWRFVEHFGVSTTGFPLKELPDKVRARYFGDEPKESRRNIGSYEAYKVLAALEDDWGLKYRSKEKRIRNVLNLRNESILAHGAIPLTEDKYKQLRNIFRETFNLPVVANFPHIERDMVLSLGLE